MFVEELKEGDLFYEFFGSDVDEFVALTTPVRNQDGLWEWTARRSCGTLPIEIINYAVHEKFEEHGPRLSFTPDWRDE